MCGGWPQLPGVAGPPGETAALSSKCTMPPGPPDEEEWEGAAGVEFCCPGRSRSRR